MPEMESVIVEDSVSSVQNGTAAKSEASDDYSTSTNVQVQGVDEADVDYSTTNVQVQGVDEADVVKTDGEFIYQVKAKTG